jgi:hypothetical protein
MVFKINIENDAFEDYIERSSLDSIRFQLLIKNSLCAHTMIPSHAIQIMEFKDGKEKRINKSRNSR